MTSLSFNVSVNVVANSNWSCLLISAPKVHWWVQPTAARWSGRFKKDACARIAPQIWIKGRYHIWGATHRAISNLHPKPKTVSELKVALEKMGHFPSVYYFHKATILASSDRLSYGIWVLLFTVVASSTWFRVLQIVWQEYVNGDGRHSKHLSPLKKCMFALTAFALSWLVETIFDNDPTAKLPWLKAA